MIRFPLRTFATLLVLGTLPAGAQSLLPPPQAVPPTNPQASVLQWIGPTTVEVAYSRPGKKDRTIFGALVPWNQVWRTGSDNATRLRVSTPIRIEGKALPAGTYELFAIPRPDRWTIIVQQSQQQWGSYAYDPVHDVLRVDVTPTHGDAVVETFTIGFGDLAPDAATMQIRWDDVVVPVRLTVDVVGLVVPTIEAAMAGDGPKPYFRAAMFYYENHLDIRKAVEYIDAAVAESPRHIGMLHRQALIHAEAGDTAGALVAARKSLAGAAQGGPELRAEYTRLNEALIAKLTGESNK